MLDSDDIRAMWERRTEISREIREGIPEEIRDNPARRTEYIFEERRKRVELEDLWIVENLISYERGAIDPIRIEEVLKALRRAGFFRVSSARPLPHESTLAVIVHDNDLMHSVTGPYGYFFDAQDSSISWDESLHFRNNWAGLIGSLTGLVDEVDPASVTSAITRIERNADTSRLYDPGDIRIRFPDTTGLEGHSSASNDLVSFALELAEVDHDTALNHLRSSLPVIADEEKSVAYRTLGYLELRAGDHEAARSAFQRVASREFPSDSIVLADANIRMGYLELREDQRFRALDHFARVATGAIPGTHDQVEEAAYRMARLLHNMNRGVQAVDVYSQLVEHARDPERRRSARLQLSGLLFELAKGDFGEVDEEERLELLEQTRAESTFLIEDPDTEPENRVVAELMYLETFYYQDDQQKCLDLGIEFVDRWTAWRDENPELVDWNINVQLSAAHNFATFSAYEVGEYELTIELARQIRERYGEGDHYRTFNVFAYSLLYEAFAQEALGNHAEGERLRERCRDEYPDWYRTIGRREARNLGLPHSMLE